MTTETALTVRRPLSVEEAVVVFRNYQDLCHAILEPSDYAEIEGKQVKKKSAWRKLGRAQSIADRIIDQHIERDESGRPIYARFTVEAELPDGRRAQGYHEAHLGEKCCPTAAGETCYSKNPDHYHCSKDCSGWRHWSHPGDIPATAHTRAKNRAISDLIGAGEVSAEELEEATDIGGEATKAPAPAGQPFCEEHQQPFRKHTKGGDSWWSHKQGSGWCNMRAEEKAEPETDQPTDSPSAPFYKAPLLTPLTAEQLGPHARYDSAGVLHIDAQALQQAVREASVTTQQVRDYMAPHQTPSAWLQANPTRTLSGLLAGTLETQEEEPNELPFE